MLKAIVLAAAAIAALTGTALAADVATSAAPDEGVSWDGFYIGADAGYGPGIFSDGSVTFPDTSIKGWFVGGQWGYNFQLTGTGLVVGAEADVNWANETGSTDPIPNGPGTSSTFSDTINWTGAVTGHVGVAWDAVMPYVLGGVAFAGNTFHNVGTNALGSFDASQTDTQIGWTAGLGVSAMVASNTSVFGEYRYSDYGTADYITGAGDSRIRLQDNSLRLGFDYHP